MTFFNININGKEIQALAGQTILQVAEANNIHIPTLCYDERTKIYGSCGLCLVEVEGMPKLARACATQISDGMIIQTESSKVRKCRKIALELLLSNHKGDCKAPCHEACPGETDCQGYVGLIANGYFEEAIALIKESYPLPASIGRVCPHPCEDKCRRKKVEDPIAIAWLKQFAADMDLASGDPFMPEIAPATGKKVAVIGGGPSGLTFAYFMAKNGHKATVFEMMPKAGGMLRYGIPEYRLPKAVLDEEISLIEKMGVDIRTNVKIGKDVSFGELRRKYDAVYVAIGAWVSSGMRCPGEDMAGVVGGIEFLGDVAQNKYVNIGKRVAVVGGGNTAMDACRTAVRLGAEEVYLLYRRTEKEMPADKVEIREAKEEGVNFKFLVAPTEVIGENGRMTALKLQQMELGEPDASGRRRPVPIEGATEVLELDTIISAIGQKVVPFPIDEADGVMEMTKWNTIIADEKTFQTSIPGVFAGGDSINNGPGIAIQAIGHAKKAARVVDSYLMGEMVPYEKPYLSLTGEKDEEYFASVEKQPRQKMAHLKPEERKNNFKEIVKGYDVNQAIDEANRCLECGCADVYECKLLAYAREYGVQPERVAGEVKETPIDYTHPYILRDYNKCILCGLCVRICDEVLGNSALGLLDRGFDSTVEADFGVNLVDSRCISCGQCVAVCPTGALTEKQPDIKTVPLKTVPHDSVCNYCGAGCHLQIHQHGAMPVKVTPTNKNQICPSGRFGYQYTMSDYNLSYPMVREAEELIPATFETAYTTIVKKIQSLQAVHGKDAVGVVIGDKLSTEEIYLAHHMAQDIMDTDMIYSANATSGGLDDVLGFDGSTVDYDQMLNTDLILLVGSATDIRYHYPMIGARILRAQKHGVQLAVISNDDTLYERHADYRLKLGPDVAVLKQIVAALHEVNPVADEAFAADIKDVYVNEEVRYFAKCLREAKHAVVVFDRGRVSKEAAQLLAMIAVMSGHIGSPRNGIMQIRPRANTQSLVDIGVKKDMDVLKEDIRSGKIKGLLFFGHDMNEEAIGNLDFLMVADTMLTHIMPYADVVLPLGGFGSVEGSFINSECKVRKIKSTISTAIGKENWQVIAALIKKFDNPEEFDTIHDVRLAIAKDHPAYKPALLDDEAVLDHVLGEFNYPVVPTHADYDHVIMVNEMALETWMKARKHYKINKGVK